MATVSIVGCNEITQSISWAAIRISGPIRPRRTEGQSYWNARISRRRVQITLFGCGHGPRWEHRIGFLREVQHACSLSAWPSGMP